MVYEKSIGVKKEVKDMFDEIYFRLTKVEKSDETEGLTMSGFLEALLLCWEKYGDIDEFLKNKREG